MMALVLSNLSCSQVEIKDEKWCTYKGTLGAHCAHTLSSVTYDYTQEQWLNRSFGQICTDDDFDKLGTQFAEIKKEQEELCSIYNACTYEQVAALHRFLGHMLTEQQKAKALRGNN